MMGTYVSISLPQGQTKLSTLAFSRLKEVEIALSSYDENAQIYQLNHNHEVNLTQDSFEALSLSKQYYEHSSGYFDITIGSITKGLFHFGEEERLPSEHELQEAKLNFHGLHFDKRSAWTEEGIVIDLGGMGKGFGVDKAVEVLTGVKQAVVALSGDIYCIGECQMGIINPFDEGLVASFTMRDRALSTSGNYRRYVQDSNYNHLINPKKRESQRTFASITLISKTHSNSDLDAYATAASVMPKELAYTFLDSLDLVYVVLESDKSLHISQDIDLYTSLKNNTLKENLGKSDETE